MRYAMIETTQPLRAAQSGNHRKDGSHPVDQSQPERHSNRPVHPDASRSATVQPTPAAPRGSSAWRQANSRTPDTLLPGNGGAFSNGDRRRTAGRSGGVHAH
jgi:hypothetical protein